MEKGDKLVVTIRYLSRVIYRLTVESSRINMLLSLVLGPVTQPLISLLFSHSIAQLLSVPPLCPVAQPCNA
ncbi:hypothetical protein U1Q18_017951, partial [Sarracenia purpurea var. burkii]